MEIFDICDENGLPTGRTVERGEAHRAGILHRTAHVWLIREEAGRTQVLLQKRSACKDSFPGCYDISSAGHIPAGVDFLPSALRELKEELGLDARAEELHYCGRRRILNRRIFNDRPFWDNQISNVYYMWRDVEPKDLSLQACEVESVEWMDFGDCLRRVEAKSFPHCISPQELRLVATGAGLAV
jgi:isopentenyldiphosphate isomerase